MLTFRTTIAATAMLVASVLPGWTNDRNFTLINNSRNDIVAVYYSQPGIDPWHVISNSRVPDGRTLDVKFLQSGECNLMLRVVFADGSAHEWDSFDFCTLNNIEVYYNPIDNNFGARWK